MSLDDLTRRLLQLERQNRALQDQIRQLRAAAVAGIAPGSRTAILQATAEIAGRTDGATAGTYDIAHGPARLFDLIVPSVGDWTLTPVKAGSSERTVELGNLWSDPIAADAFVIGQTVQGAWLHGAEECNSDG